MCVASIACSVLQPGNDVLSGSVPLGTPYPVLRYEGGTSYTMCSAFPCRRAHRHPSPPSTVAYSICVAAAEMCGLQACGTPCMCNAHLRLHGYAFNNI